MGLGDLSLHYTDPNIVYYCPTAGTNFTWTYNHYAMNILLSPNYYLPGGGFEAVGRPDRISHPEDVVMFAEAVGVSFFSGGSNQPFDHFDPRHRGVGNVMFCDQHIENMEMFTYSQMEPDQ